MSDPKHKDLEITFDRSALSTFEWNQLLKKALRANWMNTWPYAQAVQKRDFKRPQTIVIKDQNNTPIGLFILYEIKVLFVQVLEIHRGPIWFESAISQYGESNLIIVFGETFNKLYPNRLFTFRRWLPEVSVNVDLEKSVKKIGYKSKSEHYETVWISLTQSIDDLKKKLDRKWRNHLQQTLKKDTEIRFLEHAEDIYNFVWNYQTFKGRKIFIGLSPQFLLEEMNWALKLKSGLFMVVTENKQMIAGIYVSLHGHSAAYRAGWNTESGRKNKCHYLLLWKAIEILKERGYTEFDLGGLVPDQESLNNFKLGTHGEHIINMNMLS